VPDWKLRTVHNGINVHLYDGYIDPSICRRTYGIGPMDPMVLFCGRLSCQKGPDLLLDAVPGFCAVAGTPSSSCRRRGHADVPGAAGERTRRGPRGPVPGRDGLRRRPGQPLQEHGCGVRSEPKRAVRHYHSGGLGAGKPVVATRNGGPREFVTHERDGFLVHDNPGSIGWGINRIFSDFKHAQWMESRVGPRRPSASVGTSSPGRRKGCTGSCCKPVSIRALRNPRVPGRHLPI